MTLTPEQALAKVDVLYKRLAVRRREIAVLDAYFRGDHRLAYASPEWARVHQDRYRGFSDNWCGVVGSAPGERTELNGFRLGTDSDVLSTDERELWADWESNDGQAQSSQGFLAASVSKRSSVLVWGDDDDEPVMTWESPSQVIVEYDPASPRKRRAALKAWFEDDAEFATLYTADEVWKFKRSTVVGYAIAGRTPSGLLLPPTRGGMWAGGGWQPRQPREDDVWPLPNPMNVVPIVEFQNRPMLGGEPLSDIEGTIAMQDAINLLWAYLFAAADYASMPARVVMGQEPPKIPILDENGVKVGERLVDSEALTKGRMLWLTGQNTKVGQWDAAKLDVFTDVIQIATKHISAQTRTPIYLVHGELGNVNGETLTGLDAPLNSKVRESHKFYKTPVREVFGLFALVRGDTELAKACRLAAPQWANPEVRSDAQVSDAALKDRQVGWSLAGVLERRYGLPQTEIDRQLSLVAAEQSNPYLTSTDEKDALDGPPPEPAPFG